jgi:hypothetical protein
MAQDKGARKRQPDRAGRTCVERTQHIALEGLPQVGRIGERFQSYNVEMVEIIGGKFWKPYGARNGTEVPDSRADTTPTGMDPSLYRYRLSTATESYSASVDIDPRSTCRTSACESSPRRSVL